MAKAKTASKNNPTTREQGKSFFHNGQKIKPVKFISGRSSIFAAEYEESGNLVKDDNGTILPWKIARSVSR